MPETHATPLFTFKAEEPQYHVAYKVLCICHMQYVSCKVFFSQVVMQIFSKSLNFFPYLSLEGKNNDTLSIHKIRHAKIFSAHQAHTVYDSHASFNKFSLKC